MVTPPDRSPWRGPSKASAAARASESAPPEQAATARAPGGRPASAPRAASGRPPPAGGGPATAQVSSAGGGVAAVDTLQPLQRLGDLRGRGQRLRRRPDLVERFHPGLRHHRLDEPRALLVLLHLQVDAQDATQGLLHPAGLPAP